MKKSNPTSAKLVIKPFKIQPKVPDNFEDIAWGKLKFCLNAIYHKVSANISKEELYQVSEIKPKNQCHF